VGDSVYVFMIIFVIALRIYNMRNIK